MHWTILRWKITLQVEPAIVSGLASPKKAQIVSCARCTENIHVKLKKNAALNLISNLVYLCVKTE